MVDEFFDEPILAPPRYYFGACGYCQNPGSPKSPLKRCSRCQCIFYCSSACQKAHFKIHKTICKYLANAALEGGLENFFSGHQNETREEWNKFRGNAVRTCSVILSRPLDPFEQSMFLFPRVCRTTGCFSPVPVSTADMLQCEACLAAVWCSEQHRDEGRAQHAAVCRELRLSRVADRYESQVKVGIPALPSHLDKTYLGTAPDITHFVDTPVAQKSEIGSAELEFAFLTNHLSGPLTLLDMGHQLLSDFGTKTSLTVHIVGANVYEIIGIIKWEYLAHRLPALKTLQLVFVGPELEQEDDSGEGGETVGQCDDCAAAGRTVTVRTSALPYQVYRHRQHGAEDGGSPDLVLVQNCGFHEHEVGSREWEEGWAGGLPALLHPGGAPVIFTSYTRGEAEADLARLLEHCGHEVEVVVRCRENVMRSHRPIRDWEMDGDNDLFYSNQFLNVVKL